MNFFDLSIVGVGNFFKSFPRWCADFFNLSPGDFLIFHWVVWRISLNFSPGGVGNFFILFYLSPGGVEAHLEQ